MTGFLPPCPRVEVSLHAEHRARVNVAILNARSGWHTDELCRALAERGHTGLVLPYEGLVARLGSGQGVVRGLSNGSHAILDADAVLARIIPSGSLEQIIYRVDALHWIEKRGVPVDELAARDRALGGQVLHDGAAAGSRAARRPRRWSARARPTRWPRCWRMGDVVIKPIFGSMGHGMVRVSDPDVAFRVVRALEQLRAVFYVQRADRSRRPRRARLRRRRPGAGRDRAAGAGRRLADQRVARRIGAAVRPAAGVGAAGAARGGGDRRRLCRRGSAALARRHGVRARSQRHPRLAGAAAGHRARRGRRDRGPSGRARARGRSARAHRGAPPA